jgi:hypothetical protein
MTEPLRGGCLCGAIRYLIETAPLDASICHCQTCRRAVGAPSVAWLTSTAGAFLLTQGEPVRHRSSRGVVRTHCGTCGTSLTYQASPESIDVTIASLDDPERVQPTREIWTEHRLTWEPLDPGRPHLRRND